MIAVAFAGVAIVAKDLKIPRIKREIGPQLARLNMIDVEYAALIRAAPAAFAAAATFEQSAIA